MPYIVSDDDDDDDAFFYLEVEMRFAERAIERQKEKERNTALAPSVREEFSVEVTQS